MQGAGSSSRVTFLPIPGPVTAPAAGEEAAADQEVLGPQQRQHGELGLAVTLTSDWRITMVISDWSTGAQVAEAAPEHSLLILRV